MNMFLRHLIIFFMNIICAVRYRFLVLVYLKFNDAGLDVLGYDPRGFWGHLSKWGKGGSPPFILNLGFKNNIFLGRDIFPN